MFPDFSALVKYILAVVAMYYTYSSQYMISCSGRR